MKGYTQRKRGLMRTRMIKVHIPIETTERVMAIKKCSQAKAERAILDALIDRGVECCGLAIDPNNGYLTDGDNHGCEQLENPVVQIPG